MDKKNLFKDEVFRDMVKIAISEDKIFEKNCKKEKITEGAIKKVAITYLSKLDNKEEKCQ